MLLSSFDPGQRVKLVVPWGPNGGKVYGYGKIVHTMNSSIDGVVHDVLLDDGTTDKEVSESWIKPA